MINIKLVILFTIIISFIIPSSGNEKERNERQSHDQKAENISLEGTLIDINQDSYDESYSAVWFSPSTGEITPVIIEEKDNGREKLKIPESKFIFWIEPGDPEFQITREYRFEKDSKYGLQYIGEGINLFNSSESIKLNLNWQNNLLSKEESSGPVQYSKSEVLVEMAKNNSIFYIRTPEGDCLIMITDFSPIYSNGRKSGPTREWDLAFQWKKIN